MKEVRKCDKAEYLSFLEEALREAWLDLKMKQAEVNVLERMIEGVKNPKIH